MFEKFTQSARRVIVLAQEAARDLGHAHIGTEHLLLGALTVRQETGPLDIDLAEARNVTSQLVPSTSMPSAGHTPFTTRAKQALERSLREAIRSRHRFITPGHVLLAAIADPDGVAFRVLTTMGVDIERFRTQVAEPQGTEDEPSLRGPGRYADPLPRLAHLERQVALLTAQVAELRGRLDERS